MPHPLQRLKGSKKTPGGIFTPVLLALFVVSGCAAIIYEVIWLHLLRLVIGASAYSVGILLAIFMGGMFLGSLVYARLIPRKLHPLRVYAALELGMGAFGLLLPFLVPYLSQIYIGFFGYGVSGIALRAAITALCILPPTILMGATLPAISRLFTSDSDGLSRLGLLYSGNIAGAVLGSLLAAFYFLPKYDVLVATYAAVALNIALAAAAFMLSRKAPHHVEKEAETAGATSGGHGVAYTVIALSGVTALGAQVVWSRLISMLFGVTTYSFAIILAVFLGGLGIGSGLGAGWVRRGKDARLALGWCQFLLVIAIAYAAFMITQVIPFWRLQPTNPIDQIHLNNVLRCAAAILPATLLWGASFPLALGCIGKGDRDPGRSSGRVYAANTLGAIVGALGFSLVGIPLLGTRGSTQLSLVLAGIASVLIFMIPERRPGLPSSGGKAVPPASFLKGLTNSPGRKPKAAMAALVCVVAGIWLVPGASDAMLSYGRNLDKWKIVMGIPYLKEGISSTVAVQERENNINYLHVSGKVVATTEKDDMRLQRMMGHVPALIHKDPKSVLIVGLGAGVTAGSFVLYPGIERIVICEIEPSVYGAAGQYFAKENYSVLEDPRVEVIFDDARHFMATTTEKFDIITSDPIHPWVRGASSLSSREHYDLVKARLNDGGVAAKWVPFYETNEEAVKIQLRTFMDAFPGGAIWSSDIYRIGVDAVITGQKEPTRIDLARAEQRIRRNPRLKQSLADAQFPSAMSLFATYMGQGSDLKEWLSDTPPNRDLSLRLEYVAGLALNTQESSRIYKSLETRRTFPEGMFVANPGAINALKGLIARPGR
jgi:spermidine synthase